MGDKKIYIVAKIFDKQGCLAYQCKTVNEARCLPGTLEALRAERFHARFQRPETEAAFLRCVDQFVKAKGIAHPFVV